MKSSLTIVAATLLSTLSLSVQADECGEFTIADMNWNTASFMAYVDQFILNEGMDCSAELIPGDTVPTGTSMIEKGQPDVAPEMWTNGIKAAIDKGVADKRLRLAGKSFLDGGEEGFWVPDYLVEQYPEITTIEGVIQHAKVFQHPEDDEKSAFYGCPAGWTCQITSGHLFDALKLDDHGFEMIDPGSGAALAATIAKAYERERPWIGYYWAPTSVLGKYNMVKVDFGSGTDVDEFRNCTTQPECASPKVTMYPSAPVYTLTTEAFAQNEPVAFQYFESRGYTNQTMNELLAWIEDNQADSEEAMYYFFENYPHVWKEWVNADIAVKVEDAL
ncbi:glycine betaine ABC transporter substrate-binding protein [Vibrio ulleungensis]|uniref:ABC transporter substrate-binding protein n=1 Tax=Vibrio ulleungensis TaxID=2807619 RepID=A0ABS2HFE5_9VIBR|nr:glycine betaine ABC transporter substrate-binding protein [Vibrio ulleungensis]MBM7035361.1 ABC transporter substrate-binding protein [Vibrio ulleungensis]